MVDVGSKAQYESILVLLENRENLISVGIVPKHLELVVPIVAKEDVRLCEKVSLWVVLEDLLNPVDLGYGHFFVGKILIERIHTVQRNHHCVITELVYIVATFKPSLLNGFICSNRSIGWHLEEQDLPQISIVPEFVFSSRGLVMVDDIVVAEDGQDRNIWEGLDNGFHSFLHGVLHQRPIGCCSIRRHCQSMSA